jgi:hypothetical protein
MIRFFLNWLFKKQYAEARQLLDAAKALPARFVKYDHYDMATMRFLQPIQEIIKSVFLKFWLLERRAEYERLIKYGDLINREMNIGRAMAIDELLKDCQAFESKYNEILIEESNKNVEILA